jgi:hypothetical protein
MNTDTKELVKKVFGKYALMIRKAHGHWAFSDGELEQFVNMIRSDEREACAKVCEKIDEEYEGEDVLATWCADDIRARGNE